jgi:hypothetical protein
MSYFLTVTATSFLVALVFGGINELEDPANGLLLALACAGFAGGIAWAAETAAKARDPRAAIANAAGDSVAAPSSIFDDETLEPLRSKRPVVALAR